MTVANWPCWHSLILDAMLHILYFFLFLQHFCLLFYFKHFVKYYWSKFETVAIPNFIFRTLISHSIMLPHAIHILIFPLFSRVRAFWVFSAIYVCGWSLVLKVTFAHIRFFYFLSFLHFEVLNCTPRFIFLPCFRGVLETR